jgi:hypothetical protein
MGFRFAWKVTTMMTRKARLKSNLSVSSSSGSLPIQWFGMVSSRTASNTRERFMVSTVPTKSRTVDETRRPRKQTKPKKTPQDARAGSLKIPQTLIVMAEAAAVVALVVGRSIALDPTIPPSLRLLLVAKHRHPVDPLPLLQPIPTCVVQPSSARKRMGPIILRKQIRTINSRWRAGVVLVM